MKKTIFATALFLMAFLSSDAQNEKPTKYAYDLSKKLEGGKTYCIKQNKDTPCDITWQQDTNKKILYITPQKENTSYVYELPAIGYLSPAIDRKNINLDKIFEIAFQQNNKLGDNAIFTIEVESKKGNKTIGRKTYRISKNQEQKINFIDAVAKNTDSVIIKFKVTTTASFKTNNKPTLEIRNISWLCCCGGTNGDGPQMPPPEK